MSAERQHVGRCIGCRTRDWPTCGGCGADLTAEKWPPKDEDGYCKGCRNETCRDLGCWAEQSTAADTPPPHSNEATDG